MSNDHERPSSLATEKGYPTYSYHPKASATSQSKLHAEKRVEFAAQAKSQKAIYVKVEDPQLASKNHVVSHVPSRRFEGTAAAPLCPRGSWYVLAKSPVLDS
ncbi:hypothetical protein E2542_SST17132 [Spatholobus suberectus]|nr:hypothetical protein E2542_SST17132 [Spatholobus suberectus]